MGIPRQGKGIAESLEVRHGKQLFLLAPRDGDIHWYSNLLRSNTVRGSAFSTHRKENMQRSSSARVAKPLINALQRPVAANTKVAKFKYYACNETVTELGLSPGPDTL